MGFYGDLSSILLGDLFKNFEGSRRTGTLTVKGSQGVAHIYFQDGKIALFSVPERPSFADRLVAYRVVTGEQVARSKRRGKSLGESLVASKAISEQDLKEAAEAVLFEDVCNLLTTAEGKFRFTEGKPPARVFDPEERRLALALTVDPLLLEAARRADHWTLIRKLIPSDTVHFVTQPGAQCPADMEDLPLGKKILRALDGSRDVREAVELFPGRRFDAYLAVARLVKERLVRAAEGDEIIHTVSTLAKDEPKRAREILARALEAEPQHIGLLTLEARLAEQLKDKDGAAAALKMVAHLRLEAGDREKGRKLLAKGIELVPEDTSLWERLITLELQEKRIPEAVEAGMKLVKLYRAPGLHAKARDVLKRLVDVDAESVELRQELARSQVDAGDSKGAVKSLTRVGKRYVAQERYADARKIYKSILSYDSSSADARRCIELIDTESYQLRRIRFRRITKRVGVAVGLSVLLLILFYEGRARIEFVHATTEVSREKLIEKRRYEKAIELFERVAERNPYTATTLFDVRRRLMDIRSKIVSHKMKKLPGKGDSEG